MGKKRDKPGIIMLKKAWCLEPASAYDAEQFNKHGDGDQFTVSPVKGRSLPQHRLYWAMLTRAVEATDMWPSAEHLHDALKRDMGFWTVSKTIDGKPYLTTDSTAFDAMTQAEFQAFMDRAAARLAEVLGVDPLDLSEAA